MKQQEQQEQNAQNAQTVVLSFQQKDEIDFKLNLYKSIIQTYDNLSKAIDNKLLVEKDEYTCCKLKIEQLELDDRVFSQKQFFEMWLMRSKDYDQKFAPIIEDCEKNFAEVEAEARVVAEKVLPLKTAMAQFDATENPSQRIKIEYYALLKFEVAKSKKGKEEFALGTTEKAS